MPHTPNVLLEPRTILIAANDPDQSEMFSDLLSRDGFHVKTVRTGHDVFTILEKNRIDLAILDVQLSGRSGLDVLAELTQKGRSPPLKIVMIATFAPPDELHRYRLQGAHACLSKPFTYENLRSEILRVLALNK